MYIKRARDWKNRGSRRKGNRQVHHDEAVDEQQEAERLEGMKQQDADGEEGHNPVGRMLVVQLTPYQFYQMYSQGYEIGIEEGMSEDEAHEFAMIAVRACIMKHIDEKERKAGK